MRLNRQIILLFFYRQSSTYRQAIVNRQPIVNRQGIVNLSSIVNRQGLDGAGLVPVWCRSSSKAQRPKGQAREPGPGPTAGPDKPGGSMPGTRPRDQAQKYIYKESSSPQKNK